MLPCLLLADLTVRLRFLEIIGKIMLHNLDQESTNCNSNYSPSNIWNYEKFETVMSVIYLFQKSLI